MRYMVIISLVAICVSFVVAGGSRNGSSTGCYLVAPITAAFSALDVDTLYSGSGWSGDKTRFSAVARVALALNEILSGISDSGLRHYSRG